MAAYAAQAKDETLARAAAKIKLRAERRVGEMLRDMDKAKGAAQPGTDRGVTRSPHSTASPTLSAIGISKRQSADWQKVAMADKVWK